MQLTFQATVRPLERISIVLRGPGGIVARARAVRADREGTATWKRDTGADPTGAWTALVDGDQGTSLRITYTLKELDLPATPQNVGGSDFLGYRTPEASYYFDQRIHPAAVTRVAQVYARVLAMLPRTYAYTMPDRLDFFMMPDQQALVREVTAGGADAGAGLEAGISLYGFKRSGVYLDMSNPPESMPHIIAHEVAHQINARIEGNRNIPQWAEEGLAEWHGYTVASTMDPDTEAVWRRRDREIARNAVNANRWIDLISIGDPKAWFSETDVDRAELMYAESYATVDYVSRTYGENAVRSFLEKVADHPDAPDAAARDLFGISFNELQQGVRDDLFRLDDYERQAEGFIKASQAMLDILNAEQGLDADWAAYLRDRRGLSSQERVRRLQDLAARYQGLRDRMQAIQSPDPGVEARDIFVSALGSYTDAMRTFSKVETSGDARALAEGNDALQNGAYFVNAGRDRLFSALNQYQIDPAQMGLAATPTPRSTASP